jgi:hypothetical protein
LSQHHSFVPSYNNVLNIKKGTGAGVYCHGTRRKLSFSLGQYTKIFQAEVRVYAIKTCAVKIGTIRIGTSIVYQSHAAIKALGKHQIT